MQTFGLTSLHWLSVEAKDFLFVAVLAVATVAVLSASLRPVTTSAASLTGIGPVASVAALAGVWLTAIAVAARACSLRSVATPAVVALDSIRLAVAALASARLVVVAIATGARS